MGDLRVRRDLRLGRSSDRSRESFPDLALHAGVLGVGVFRRVGAPGQLADLPVPGGKRLWHPERTEGFDLCRHFVDDGFDPLALGGRNPLQPHALLGDSQVFEEALEELKAAEHLVVALDVVAVAGVTAADEHAVGPLAEGIEDELGIDAARAHQADHPHARRVFQARHAGQIGGGVGAPVAEKSHDPWSPGTGGGGCWFNHGVRTGASDLFRISGFNTRASDVQSASMPSISLNTSSYSKRFCTIEPEGQEPTQVPQPLHKASLMTAFLVASSKVMAV